MQVLSGGRGLFLLVERSKETSDCVVCGFTQIRGAIRNERDLQSGFRIHEVLFTIAASSFNCFWFWLPQWDKCSYAPHPTGMELIHFLPPGQGSGIFLWDVGVCTVVMLTDPQSTDSELFHQALLPPILLLFRHSTSHTSISPAYTQPELMGAAHALALMHLLTKVAIGAHSARFLVMLNHSPHAGMLAHSELWPRFSGTAPWWTCRTTRRSASL